jgi:hypothetical protein
MPQHQRGGRKDRTVADPHGDIEQLARRIDQGDRGTLDVLHHQIVGTDVVKRTDIRLV